MQLDSHFPTLSFARERRIALISLHADPTSTVGAPENGGVTVYVRELARAFAAEKWEVDIITRRTSPTQPARESRFDATVVRIDVGPARPLANDDIAAFLPQACDAMRRLARERDYAFVSSHYWLSGVAGEAAARACGVGHVHTLHSHGVARRQRDAVTLERIEAERRLLRDATIVALSASHLPVFHKKYGMVSDAHVVPGGVDTERFCHADRAAALLSLGLSPDVTWIGYVGRLTREKGIDDLLKAFALSRSRGCDAQLFVVGGARKKSRIPDLSEQARNLGIVDAVRFLGSIANDDVAVAFQAADVIAVPSHYEAFGLVALEAMATGTPIVASDVGGLRDLVKEERGGKRVPARDASAWADALAEALQPHELRRRASLAMRADNEDIRSWRSVARSIASIALARSHA
jgi:D-inositol-3-phosphate glycosyltransferase